MGQFYSIQESKKTPNPKKPPKPKPTQNLLKKGFATAKMVVKF